MTKYKFERQTPENRLERAITNGAQKMKRLILQKELRVDPIRDKLDAAALNLADQFKVDITSSEILKRALEMLYKDGTFSDKLKEEYINLIAEETADEVAAGKKLPIVLGEKGVELKQKGIEIDMEEIREKSEQG